MMPLVNAAQELAPFFVVQSKDQRLEVSVVEIALGLLSICGDRNLDGLISQCSANRPRDSSVIINDEERHHSARVWLVFPFLTHIYLLGFSTLKCQARLALRFVGAHSSPPRLGPSRDPGARGRPQGAG
jgi:hypothetical protein